MDSKQKVLVIGAGIGGLTTAICLAKKGFEVTVVEKNPGPGGRCGQLWHEGHRFDLGATMLLMPNVYRQVFDAAGIDFDSTLRAVPLHELYRLYFDDGSQLSFTTDEKKMEAQLEAVEKGSFKMSEKYVKEGYRFYSIASDNLIGRNFLNIFQFATLKNLSMLLKLKVHLTHQQYIQRFFRDPHLQMAYTFQNIYVGQSPFDSPAFFSMIPAIELKEGSFFPEGGIFKVVETLKTEADKCGIKFLFDTEVSSINVNGKVARNISLSTGEILDADIIVANADLPYVYKNLLPDRRMARRFDSKKYSCSAMVFHWGLDKKFPQFAHHNVFLSDTFRTGLRVIFRDKAADPNPSFYVHAPSRSDPAAAPKGCDTLSVIVGIGHLDESKDQDWNAYRKMTREAVLRRLSEAGMPDLEEHISHEICYNPGTWESVYNVTKGSVFGSLSHSLLQMGYFRPHNRHRKYRNLYFTGGSTHPGNGIPLVLLSAKLTSERILLENKGKE
ncbi:MAG: phytoene desaturase family protein [Bacteroidales bacterium]